MLYIQIIVNNLFNNIIDLTFNEVCYDFRVKNFTSILFIDNFVSAKIFNKLRFIKREKVNDVITFIIIFIKIKYDIKYLFLNFKKKDETFLKLYYDYFIFNFFNRKLL